ncbi:DUF4194 domain-containing protein [Luteolibacter algae]|uniref:DUF4194 domain-containing protein n=1 Tax=Luteolibacter algae TaxID=454151 RepID=A0ABW5D334_9BACT
MTEEYSHTLEAPQQEGLIAIPDAERARLGEALQELLSTGSISGLGTTRSALYHWCRQYFDWVKEAAALAGLDVLLVHEERLIQAIPQSGALRLRMQKDATIVWLALWYAGDVCWRDEGQDQALLTVAELNGLIQDQLLPDSLGVIPRSRMREILRQAARFNLIRFEHAEPFDQSGIEVLPAIRRIVPFRDLAEWTESAAEFSTEQLDADPTDTSEGAAGDEEPADMGIASPPAEDIPAAISDEENEEENV